MEANMAQQLAGRAHEPLFRVFIDVRKAYDSVDRERCMEILRGYGLRSKLQMLLQWYWDAHKVVPKYGKFFGRPFHMDRGVKQGDLVSLTIFNIVVVAVVRTVLLEVCGPQEKHHGFGWSSGENSICFYAGDGKMTGCNPIWVQTTLTQW